MNVLKNALNQICVDGDFYLFQMSGVKYSFWVFFLTATCEDGLSQLEVFTPEPPCSISRRLPSFSQQFFIFSLHSNIGEKKLPFITTKPPEEPGCVILGSQVMV